MDMLQYTFRIFQTRGLPGSKISLAQAQNTHKNYPVSTLGVFDTAQQLNHLAIAASSREYCVMYGAMMDGVRKLVLEEYNTLKIIYSMSGNSDAIGNAI